MKGKYISLTISVSSIFVAIIMLLPGAIQTPHSNVLSANKIDATSLPVSSSLKINPAYVVNGQNIPNNTTLTVSPPVHIPNVKPVNYTIVSNAITTHGSSAQYPDNYYFNVTLPNTASWQLVTMNYSLHVVGTVYDTRGWMSVDNVAVFKAICPEDGYITTIDNLTNYQVLFHGLTRFYFSPPSDALLTNGTPQGYYATNVTISLYPGTTPAGLPNQIISVVPFTQINDKTPGAQETFPLSVPANTRAAVLQVWITSSGNEEFWYTLEPSYRAVKITSGSTPIANILPFYKIRTGGIDLNAWRPLSTPFEMNGVPYNVNLTAALGILESNSQITFKISDIFPAAAFWMLRVNMLLWTSPEIFGATQVFNNYHASNYNIKTDMSLPGGGTAGTPSYFEESRSVGYSYASTLSTRTGSIFISSGTSEFSYMNQYAVTPIWENLSGYQNTVFTQTTSYNEIGQHYSALYQQRNYYPIQLQTGFLFTITKSTNGGFPMFGPFSILLNNFSVTYEQTAVTKDLTSGIAIETSIYNQAQSNNDNTSGVIELFSPVAGAIISTTFIGANTNKTYIGTTTLINGLTFTVEDRYYHFLAETALNPPPPNEFGTVTQDIITITL